MSFRKTPLYMRKVESRQLGPPAKKAKLDEILAEHCRADLVTKCMKKTNIIRWLSFSFFGRKWMSIFVSFSAVNEISFSSAFSFTAENENAFRSASSIRHKKVLILVLKKSIDYITAWVWSWPLSFSLQKHIDSWCCHAQARCEVWWHWPDFLLS